MGLLISKLRKKKTTFEVLESIEKEIKTIEEFRRNTEQTHKRIVGRFVIISVGFYLVTAFLFYFYYFPANFYDRLFYIIPLIFAPVIILFVKRILTWYYQRKILTKQNKLVTLRDEKKDILEKVMETETYKIAKSILDKFAPSESNNRKPVESGTPIRSITQVPTSTVRTGLRQRAISPNQQILPTPIRPLPINRPVTSVVMKTEGIPTKPQAPVMGTPLPMPRPFLPRDRSVFDRMVDYVVGDGPSNRYALICRNCAGHNGMAYPDEFEYLTFRCCYCYTFNPARKKRPVAPKFEYKLKSHDESSDSESERNSSSDTNSGSDDGVVVLKSAQEVAESHEDHQISTLEMKAADDVKNNDVVTHDDNAVPIVEVNDDKNNVVVKQDEETQAINKESENDNLEESPKLTENVMGDDSEVKD